MMDEFVDSFKGYSIVQKIMHGTHFLYAIMASWLGFSVQWIRKPHLLDVSKKELQFGNDNRGKCIFSSLID